MDVTLRALRKRFSSHPVLDGISLDLAPGRIIALIGLNGAGKTTLLRCLAGLVVPSGGSIAWDGRDDLRDRLDLQRRLFFLPDAPVVLAEHTPLEHLVMVLRAYERADAVDDDSVLAVLRELDLLPHADQRLGQLSRGQVYKAALAALLLVHPELWLLDEPFASGMDPQGMHVLKRRARAAAEAGACIVYTTQIIEIAERFCDELLVLDGGVLAQRFDRAALRALPPEGPGSLGELLAAYRERR